MGMGRAWSMVNFSLSFGFQGTLASSSDSLDLSLSPANIRLIVQPSVKMGAIKKEVSKQQEGSMARRQKVEPDGARWLRHALHHLTSASFVA